MSQGMHDPVTSPDCPEQEACVTGLSPLIGDSPAMQRVRTLIRQVASTDATVLISGESGTGKELVARAVHEQSHRRDHPLIRVNCAAVPRELFESEFFGHVRGAYTGAHSDRPGRFELADGGTLFLDEVGEIPPELQGKLLGVLQERCFERVGDGRARHVNVRMVAATNRDLPVDVATGRFRRDLFYRLNVFPIELPPLRARREDIPLLVRHLLARAGGGRTGAALSPTEADLAMLKRHDWPGNVRELRNVIERALVVGCIEQACRSMLDDLPERQSMTPGQHAHRSTILTETQRRTRDRDNILTALALAEGRIAGPGGAAELLELKPTTLRSRMKALGIATTPARGTVLRMPRADAWPRFRSP